jgi:hypothetical protein
MRLVDEMAASYRAGYLDLVTKLLLELDEWADSVGASFVMLNDETGLIELWLYGSHNAQWHFAPGKTGRYRSQDHAQDVS